MSGGGGAGLMSCVREGSLEPPYRPQHVDQHSHGEGRTGRFLRGLRRMFKRRGSGSRVDASPDPKSSSTSELLDAERHARRKEGAYGSGLSVSHDSVFTGERSGDESSDERDRDRPTPHHRHHIPSSHRAELVAAVRRRGRGDDDDDDEDLGLPSSPPASPPTDKADKRHHAGISQSSCSDGSLLSVGSSEMDEDSSSSHHHSHDHSNRSDQSDFYNSSEPPTGVAPLSHSAARHKMAVRPRRTHGAPRRKKNTPITATALPITPELNEEVLRSATPDITQKTTEVFTEFFSSSTTTKQQVMIKEQHHKINKELQKVQEGLSDTKLKSSSLPPGLALSQLAGHPTSKLSIAEENTPRSSIKRSKSSTQGQPLREGSPNCQTRTSETQIDVSTTDKYRTDNKYADEACLEKKSKPEKKIENDAIRSSKKDESFFSRWLTRKSGKKTKKDQPDGECQQEIKKSKMDKPVSQYKPIETERGEITIREPITGPKPVPAERTHKSAGQKAFANQMHKRIDNKGAYVQEGVYKDSFTTAKVSSVESSSTDLKVEGKSDKVLDIDMQNRFNRKDDLIKEKRTSYTAFSEINRRDSINLHQDKSSALVDAFSSKIRKELGGLEKETNVLPIQTTTDEPHTRAVSIRKASNENVFHSGSMPKNIPFFNPNIAVSDNSSPPKNIRHSSENIKQTHRSSEFLERKEKEVIESKLEKSYRVTKTEESYVNSGLRTLGEEFIEHRSSIGKSQSFRYASECTSISSQDSQMPSLPAIVGISDPLQSWGVNYRKIVSDRQDMSKRISARNYDVIPSNAEASYDSLPSTDSSYQDSLKTDLLEDRKKFTNSIHITLDNDKRESVISQIEARIYDIISSPKPIMAPILKSSSLDSVKSSPEKVVDERRKTISVEGSLSQDRKLSNSNVKLDAKPESESFISVTHINKEQSPITVKTMELKKINKSDEKLQKSGSDNKPGIPEFLFLQLNKVDPKPATHVVLTANIMPKKIDSPQTEKEQEAFDLTGTKLIHNVQMRRESVATDNNLVDGKHPSPVVARTLIQSVGPQSPLTPKSFLKKTSISVDKTEKEAVVKSRNNSISTEESNEKIDNMDQKSHSSFGSKSSIQSTDSNEIKTPDRTEETVILRKKSSKVTKDLHGDRKNDDEPELMKVFARRSLKLKDSEVENITQEISDAVKKKDEIMDQINATRSKILKNEFNASIKSRDSDKENDETVTKDNEENRTSAIAARVSQFGNLGQHYQRSVSINNVVNSNLKRESAPTLRNEVTKYKKEVSDSTPEKRLRNRTFPELSNDRDDMKRNDTMVYKDTLPKITWQRKDSDKETHENAVIDTDGEKEEDEESVEKGAEDNVDEALQFKCIFERRAEWEKRAKQGMTK